MTELRFDGRVALVTGAGRGLGRAYAAELARRGAAVVVNDIDGDVAREAAASIPGSSPCVADVATATGAAAIVEHALAGHGRLDIVIANAGTSWHEPFDSITADDLRHVLAANLFGTFNVVRAAWAHLVEQRFGRIVTTASGAVFGFGGRAHYAAAKGAVLGLSNTLAVEGGPHGVHVNCILPWGATRLARPGSRAPDADLAAPAVAWLCHDSCAENGGAFVVGGGRISRVSFAPGRSIAVAANTSEAYRDALR